LGLGGVSWAGLVLSAIRRVWARLCFSVAERGLARVGLLVGGVLVCCLRVLLFALLPPLFAGIACRLLPYQPVTWASPLRCAFCLGMGLGLCLPLTLLVCLLSLLRVPLLPCSPLVWPCPLCRLPAPLVLPLRFVGLECPLLTGIARWPLP
jgi:hypothetical protein